MKNYFISRCEKSHHICDQNQYAEASFLGKLMLNLHLFYCNSCRKYSKRNANLSKLIKRADMKCMCSQKKKELQKLMEAELQRSK